MANYQGVIFDLDGTLSDSVPLILASSQYTHQKLGLPWQEAEQRSWIGKPLYQCAAYYCGDDQEKVERYLQLFREYGKEHIAEMIRPFPGVMALLQQLQQQGVKICIVTSRLRWSAELSCDVLGLWPYLTALIGVEDTKTHKPEPEPALLALAKMDLPPRQVVFVGDSPVDLACGQAAGTAAIGVAWGVSSKETLLACRPTAFCNTTAELAAALLGEADSLGA